MGVNYWVDTNIYCCQNLIVVKYQPTPIQIEHTKPTQLLMERFNGSMRQRKGEKKKRKSKEKRKKERGEGEAEAVCLLFLLFGI